jgi:hypothetical protein
LNGGIEDMKIKGLKTVCSESKTLPGMMTGCYLQLNYDMKKHEVFTNLHCSLGHNSWTRYDDENIIVIGNIDGPMSMKDIEKFVIDTYKQYAADMLY